MNVNVANFCILLTHTLAAPVTDCSSEKLAGLAARMVEAGAPGAAVMVIDGERVSIGVTGVRAAGKKEPITEADLWHLGSNTKAMTAVLVARLVEAGRIGWHDTLEDRLGDVLEEIHEEYRPATFIELLSHTSGLPANPGGLEVFKFLGADADRDTRADRLRVARSALSAAPAGPRGRFLYSNLGYMVAAAMLEAATDQRWEDLIRTEVFEPLGMDSAGFGPPGKVGTLDQPRGHRTGLFGRPVALEPGPLADNPPVLGPAGRVHIRLDDYARFLRAVISGIRGEDERFLTSANWTRLVTPPEGGDYALGWDLSPDGSLEHNGSNTMWVVRTIVQPHESRAAVVAVNDGRLNRMFKPMDEVLEEALSKAE